MATNIATEIELADAPPIPGLRFIAFDMDRDIGRLVELMVEANLAALQKKVKDLTQDRGQTPPT